MPFNYTSVDERLVSAAREGSLIPFVGSGISKQSGNSFLNWTELLNKIKDKALKDKKINQKEAVEVDKLIKRDRFLMAAQHLKSKFTKDEYGKL